jgi:hypothetical protein
MARITDKQKEGKVQIQGQGADGGSSAPYIHAFCTSSIA